MRLFKISFQCRDWVVSISSVPLFLCFRGAVLYRTFCQELGQSEWFWPENWCGSLSHSVPVAFLCLSTPAKPLAHEFFASIPHILGRAVLDSPGDECFHSNHPWFPSESVEHCSQMFSKCVLHQSLGIGGILMSLQVTLSLLEGKPASAHEMRVNGAHFPVLSPESLPSQVTMCLDFYSVPSSTEFVTGEHWPWP